MVQFNLGGDSTANEMMSNPEMEMSNNTAMTQENSEENSKNAQLTLAHSLLKNVTKLIDTVLNQNQ